MRARACLPFRRRTCYKRVHTRITMHVGRCLCNTPEFEAADSDRCSYRLESRFDLRVCVNSHTTPKSLRWLHGVRPIASASGQLGLFVDRSVHSWVACTCTRTGAYMGTPAQACPYTRPATSGCDRCSFTNLKECAKTRQAPRVCQLQPYESAECKWRYSITTGRNYER